MACSIFITSAHFERPSFAENLPTAATKNYLEPFSMFFQLLLSASAVSIVFKHRCNVSIDALPSVSSKTIPIIFHSMTTGRLTICFHGEHCCAIAHITIALFAFAQKIEHDCACENTLTITLKDGALVTYNPNM